MHTRGRILCALVGAAVAATTAAPAASAAADGPLYVLGARSLAAHQAPGGGYVVKLQDVDPHVTSFATPHGTPTIAVTTRELASNWKRLGFDRRRPLATIDPAGDRRRATLVRLGRPTLSRDGSTVVLKATPVRARAARLADRLQQRATRVPAIAAATTLTIDAEHGDADTLDAIADPLVAGSSGGWWQKVHVLMNSVPSTVDGDRHCSSEEFGRVDTTCRGAFEFDSVKWPGGRSNHGGTISRLTEGVVSFEWYVGPADLSDLSVDLVGWLPSGASNQWTVTRGFLGDAGSKVVSGTDPAWTDSPGGPLDLNVRWDPNDGYKFEVYGYLWHP